MSRIRSIKPDIWFSHDFCQLSILGRLVWVILITQADDEGRLHVDAHHLAKTFLHDGRLASAVQSQLDRMQSAHMLLMYRSGIANGSLTVRPDTVAICNWASHQRISHPTPSRIQKPPEFPENSGGFRKFREDSTLMDRKDRKDRKEGYISAAENGSALALVSKAPIEQVFDAWVNSTGKSSRTHLDAKRRRVIGVALNTYPLEEVLLAIDGWRNSPHHRGENDRATQYNDIELLLRDSKHIEMFRDLALNGPVPTPIPSKTSLGGAYRQTAAQLREIGQ